MPQTGKDSKVYFFIESAGWKLGDPNVDLQIAFNPMERIVIPKPIYTQKQIRTSDSLDFNMSFTELLQVGEGDIECVYKDPFLQLTAFGKKVVASPWTGTDDTITADFTADTHKDSIGINYLKKSIGGADVQRSLLGGEVTSIGLKCEAGDLVREVVGVKIANFSTGYKAYVKATGYDDGAWSNWNGNAPNGYHSSQVTLKFNATGFKDHGFKWKSFEWKSRLDKTQEHVGSSKIADIRYPGEREHLLTLTGKFTSTSLQLELEKDEKDRIHGDCEIILTDDAGNTETRKFTNAIIDTCDNYDIPPAAEAKESTITIKGTRKPALSFSGNYDEADDPDAYITD